MMRLGLFSPSFNSILTAKAVAAWSTGRRIGAYAGTIADISGGNFTTVYDQIGARNATGTAAVGTGTIGGLNYPKLNGTTDQLAFTDLALGTASFEVWAAVGVPTGMQFVGSYFGSASSSCSITGDGAAQITVRSISNSQANNLVFTTVPGVNIIRMIIDASLARTFFEINGERPDPTGRAIPSGGFTFNRIGRRGTAAVFSQSGPCEIIVFNKVLTAPEAEVVRINMNSAWRKGLFVDSINGLDANLGWNDETAKQTVGSFISLIHRRGSTINLKRGSLFKNPSQPLAFNTTNQGGIKVDPIVVQSYGDTSLSLPIIDGAVAVAGSGMAVVTGTEYAVTTAITSPQGAWAESSDLPANLLGDKVLRLVLGTAGALTYTPASGTPNAPGYSPAIAQWAYSGGALHVNVGGPPTNYTFQVASETGSQTSGFRPAKNYISGRGLILQYWSYDGVSFEVTQTGARGYFLNSRYNANDSFGGGGNDVGLEDCTGGYSGQVRTLSGPAGDMYSWHGGTDGYRLRCTGYGADKAGIDDLDTTTITNIDMYIQGCNQGVLCVLNGGGGLGTFNNCVWVRESTDAPDIINCSANANNTFNFPTVFNNDVPGVTHGIRLSTGGNIILKNAVFKGCAVDISFSAALSFVHDHCCVPDAVPYSGVGAGTGDITLDPQFVSEANLNFVLLPTSPCIGAGTAITGVTTDYTGAPRANPPSMGAYES